MPASNQIMPASLPALASISTSSKIVIYSILFLVIINGSLKPVHLLSLTINIAINNGKLHISGILKDKISALLKLNRF